MTWFILLVDLYRTALYVTSMKLCDLFWKTAKGKYIQCKCRRIDSKVKKGLSIVIFLHGAMRGDGNFGNHRQNKILE